MLPSALVQILAFERRSQVALWALKFLLIMKEDGRLGDWCYKTNRIIIIIILINKHHNLNLLSMSCRLGRSWYVIHSFEQGFRSNSKSQRTLRCVKGPRNCEKNKSVLQIGKYYFIEGIQRKNCWSKDRNFFFPFIFSLIVINFHDFRFTLIYISGACTK